jgi:hypothetical protein
MRTPLIACWQFCVLLFRKISNTLYVAFICTAFPLPFIHSSTDYFLAARQTMQAVQFRSRRALPHALGRYSDLL